MDQLFALSCTDITSSELDMNTDLNLSGESAGLSISVGGDEAGEAAGDSAGTIAGESMPVLSGVMAGDATAGVPLIEAGETAGDNAGDTPNPQNQCGEVVCDANAVCVSGADGPTCQCESRYEGDGISCAPTLSTNASGGQNVLVMRVMRVT